MNHIIFEDMEALYGRNIEWSRLNGNRVMVTGAYGMLASGVVFMLIYLNEYHDANIEIMALGRNESKAKARFGEYYNRHYFHFIKSDLREIPKLKISPDYIIHAASPASSQFYGVCPVDVTVPNVIGTYNLCDMALQNPVKSFLFISSGEVYGNMLNEVTCEDDFGTLDPTIIRNCYAESKRMGECVCKCYCHQYGIPVKMARLAHTFGPTMDINNDKRVFSEFVKNAVNREKILIKSDGKSKRIFCYYADAVAAFFTILFNGKDGEAYNVSNTAGSISIGSLADMISDLFPERNLSPEISARSTNETYIENASLKNRNFAYNTKKLENLGWRCEYSIGDGFYRTIVSFRNDKGF